MHQDIEIQGISLRKIAEKFGTPLYVYDSDGMRNNYLSLKNNLPEAVEIYYSMKANPNISICNFFKKMGSGVEVCSLVELEIALLAGFHPNNIIFVGPAKKTIELARALDIGIDAIVCESVTEIEKIAALAKSKNIIARIAVRINPTFSVKNASLKMGGVASQFGIDEEWVIKNKNFFLSQKNIKIIGLHVYNGTRILHAEIMAENTHNILMLAQRIRQQWKTNFSLLDIGGGIGVPYFKEEPEFELIKMRELLWPLLTNFIKNNPTTRILLESGRYLTATAGMFVCRVQDVKHSRDKIFLITDGGMNCHLTAAGYGSLVKRNFPIVALSNSTSSKKIQYQITGPLCTPADVIGQCIGLTEIRVGDLIVVKSSGAYGPTASPVLFLGHGHPAEVLVAQGKALLIRERDTVSDFLRKQKIF